MPHIEELPHTGPSRTPGWAYVPDTGYDPSKAAINPSGSRKRARNGPVVVSGTELSTRQQNAIRRHIEELENDGDRSIPIPQSSKGSRSSGAIKKILSSQKTIKHYLDDEEALLASQAALPHSQIPASFAKAPRTLTRRPSGKKKASTTPATPTPARAPTPITPVAGATPMDLDIPQTNACDDQTDGQPDPLLKVSVPAIPSEEEIEALLSAPPLSYAAARAAPPSANGPPQRYFCEVCGYWGRVRCLKCGVRVCGLECKENHDNGGCARFYA